MKALSSYTFEFEFTLFSPGEGYFCELINKSKLPEILPESRVSLVSFPSLRRWTYGPATMTSTQSNVMITRYSIGALDERKDCFRVERTVDPATWENLQPPQPDSMVPTQELDYPRFQLLLDLISQSASVRDGHWAYVCSLTFWKFLTSHWCPLDSPSIVGSLYYWWSCEICLSHGNCCLLSFRAVSPSSHAFNDALFTVFWCHTGVNQLRWSFVSQSIPDARKAGFLSAMVNHLSSHSGVQRDLYSNTKNLQRSLLTIAVMKDGQSSWLQSNCTLIIHNILTMPSFALFPPEHLFIMDPLWRFNSLGYIDWARMVLMIMDHILDYDGVSGRRFLEKSRRIFWRFQSQNTRMTTTTLEGLIKPYFFPHLHYSTWKSFNTIFIAILTSFAGTICGSVTPCVCDPFVLCLF